MFSNMEIAYETLDEEIKKKLKVKKQFIALWVQHFS